ncbi:MAG: hypothetical protein IPK78_11455 [Rhodospirillales bacterium]|nr:hypothetical protein [Rhodospirillales bacterium]
MDSQELGRGTATVIDTLSNTVSIQGQLRDIHESLKADLPSITRVAVAIYDARPTF